MTLEKCPSMLLAMSCGVLLATQGNHSNSVTNEHGVAKLSPPGDSCIGGAADSSRKLPSRNEYFVCLISRDVFNGPSNPGTRVDVINHIHGLIEDRHDHKYQIYSTAFLCAPY
ncbi:hypothetical protein PT974_04657 [Cladobotryum mycophilum]|uniref:Secreted protein n=1 Tax=Cladobotryum mycophilum TaxID=491253 RepID=A0ABR0SWS9_9HYPO